MEGTASWGEEACDRGLRVDCDGGQRRLTAHEVLDELAERDALLLRVTCLACKVVVRGAAGRVFCGVLPIRLAEPIRSPRYLDMQPA